MDNKTKERLTDRIQDATADAVQSLACPGCGGSLRIQFAPKGLRSKSVGSLSVMCRQCMWRVIADGIPNVPPWVQTLGQKFETKTKSEVLHSETAQKHRRASATRDSA